MSESITLELDLAAALGADGDISTQQIALYIPNKDQHGRELGTQRRWVLEAITVSTPQVLTSGADEPHHRYTIVQADFAEVRGFNNDTASANDYSALYFLDKNKGNYEIRITRNNQLTRTIAFTVGGNGSITDNRFAKNANLGGVRMIFPAKITGTSDSAYNATAWQTEALFGNPFAGFTVP